MKKNIISIIIASVFITIVFYIWGQFQKEKDMGDKDTTTTVETKKNTNTVDMSDWQKYQSEENDVEFKYPSTWEIIADGNGTSKPWTISEDKSKDYFYFKDNLEAKIIMTTAETFSPGGGNFIALYKFSLKNNRDINNRDKNVIESLIGRDVIEIEKYTTEYLPHNKTIFIKKHPRNIGPAYVYISFKKEMYVLETKNPGGGHSSKYIDIAVKIAETITPL